MAHAVTANVTEARRDQWGTTYLAAGPLMTPDDRNPIVRVYWLIRGDDPRLVHRAPRRFDAQGWHAGRLAADLAHIGTDRHRLSG